MAVVRAESEAEPRDAWAVIVEGVTVAAGLPMTARARASRTCPKCVTVSGHSSFGTMPNGRSALTRAERSSSRLSRGIGSVRMGPRSFVTMCDYPDPGVSARSLMFRAPGRNRNLGLASYVARAQRSPGAVTASIY